MSRPQRSLRKIFIIYCEGDTEYGNIYQKDIYPSIITVPVKWDYVIPYGIMYRENIAWQNLSLLMPIRPETIRESVKI